jgi:hypothetical protein
MDPLAEDYISWSPYNYVLNNPVIFVDPDGKKVKITIAEYEGHISSFPLVEGVKDHPTANNDIGGAISYWTGSGTDDYGNFIVNGAINFGLNEIKGGKAKGADIGVSFSRIVDSKSKSIDEYIWSEAPESFAIGPLEIISGDGKFGLGIGLSVGAGLSKANTIAANFLAFTDEDIKGVGGIVTGYSINKDGYVVFDVQCGDVNWSTPTEIQAIEQGTGQYYTSSYLEAKQNYNPDKE